MSPKIRQRLLAFIGFLLLGGIGYGVFVIVRAAIGIFERLDSDVAVAIVTAGAAVFASAVSVVGGKLYEARQKVLEQHRDRKIPVYETLIKFMFRAAMGQKTGETPTQQEIKTFFHDVTERITVWGSDDVIAYWSRYRRELLNDIKPERHVFLFEEMILTIRRDLGHKNKGLKRGDILALFINDIDKYLPPGKS